MITQVIVWLSVTVTQIYDLQGEQPEMSLMFYCRMVFSRVFSLHVFLFFPCFLSSLRFSGFQVFRFSVFRFSGFQVFYFRVFTFSIFRFLAFRSWLLFFFFFVSFFAILLFCFNCGFSLFLVFIVLFHDSCILIFYYYYILSKF
jgi:hypothetical protein